MKSQTYIEQELKAGCLAHYHAGVWWQSHAAGGCKPVLPFQQIVPGTAAPRLGKSLLGYNHLAPADACSTGRAAFYLLRGQALRSYSLDNLNDGKRRGILKAQRAGIVITRLTSLEPFWEDLRELAMSATSRTGYGKPAEFYRVHFPQWQESLRREFAKPDREWWGAFRQGRLGAYMYGYLIDHTLHLANVKIHTDFVKQHAGDLLLYWLVEHSKTLSECSQVDVGRSAPNSPSVDRWKELHGFERVEFGEHYCYRLPVRLALRGVLCLSRKGEQPQPASAAEVNGASFLDRLRCQAMQMAERLGPALGAGGVQASCAGAQPK
jgi:hypothetical protein